MTPDVATLYHDGFSYKAIAAQVKLRLCEVREVIHGLIVLGSVDPAIAKDARQRRRGTATGPAADTRARRARYRQDYDALYRGRRYDE